MGNLWELDAIAAAAIGGASLMGGKGSIVGTLLGAIILGSLRNGLTLATCRPSTNCSPPALSSSSRCCSIAPPEGRG